jgi:hypothetical protein
MVSMDHVDVLAGCVRTMLSYYWCVVTILEQCVAAYLANIIAIRTFGLWRRTFVSLSQVHVKSPLRHEGTGANGS